MSDSSGEMTTQERIIQDRVNQTRIFLRSNGFNQSLKDLWREIKEDAKYDLLWNLLLPCSKLEHLIGIVFSSELSNPKRIGVKPT